MFGFQSLAQMLRRVSRHWALRDRIAKRELQTLPDTGKQAIGPLALSESETPERIRDVDQNLKKRIKSLGEAINQSLSESQPLAEAIAGIKEAGYDVFLVLEATIGFTKQDEETAARPAMVTAASSTGESQFRITAQDMKFLKSLRIKLDDAV